MFILQFFGFIIILALFLVLFIGLSLLSTLFGGISNFIRILRGEKPEARQQSNDQQARTYYNNRQGEYVSEAQNQNHNRASNGKIFAADEGTYVDFEEINVK